MWGNPTRDRDIYYSSSGKYSTAAISHFQPREIPHSHNKTVPKILPWKTCPSSYSSTTSFKYVPRKTCPTECCMTCTVRSNNNKKISRKMPRFLCQSLPQKLHPSSCCIDCMDPYSTTQHRKMEQHYTQKIALGFVPSFSLGNVPSKLLTFLSQAYSENLFHSTPLVFSMCLAHYPMHSFINLKMTFPLQNVFSPSPTLNPKAKIRSFIFQDQGS
jgi:hypothetical protein